MTLQRCKCGHTLEEHDEDRVCNHCGCLMFQSNLDTGVEVRAHTKGQQARVEVICDNQGMYRWRVILNLRSGPVPLVTSEPCKSFELVFRDLRQTASALQQVWSQDAWVSGEAQPAPVQRRQRGRGSQQRRRERDYRRRHGLSEEEQ